MTPDVVPLLEVRCLSKNYLLGGAAIPALVDVDFALNAAEFVGLAGPSGSGKSTLLNILGAIDRPNGGEVRVEGGLVDYSDEKALETYRRHAIGFIFQSFNLAPVLTAQENVELALINHRLSKTEVKTRSRQMLSAVGLDEHADKFPRQLSGGQQQRVSVARALVKRPKIVLADEPTASLDGANAFKLVRLLRSLSADFNTAFLISTHDPRLLDLLPRIVHMEDGVARA